MYLISIISITFLAIIMPKQRWDWKRSRKTAPSHQRNPLISYQVSYNTELAESCDHHTRAVITGVSRVYRSVPKWEDQMKPGGFEFFWDKWYEDFKSLILNGAITGNDMFLLAEECFKGKALKQYRRLLNDPAGAYQVRQVPSKFQCSLCVCRADLDIIRKESSKLSPM